MASPLVEIHDAINRALDFAAKHATEVETSRELGQVEHKLIEAKLWLGTVNGAAEAILNDLSPEAGKALGTIEKAAGDTVVASGLFPTASPPPNVPERSMANDPEPPAVTPTAPDAGTTPEPPAPAPDIPTIDHAPQVVTPLEPAQPATEPAPIAADPTPSASNTDTTSGTHDQPNAGAGSGG